MLLLNGHTEPQTFQSTLDATHLDDEGNPLVASISFDQITRTIGSYRLLDLTIFPENSETVIGSQVTFYAPSVAGKLIQLVAISGTTQRSLDLDVV
jgi:hypothetical protein